MNTVFHRELIHETAFVAANATVVGDVTLEANVTVLFSAVLRGDVVPIHIGEASNVQDLCCLHGDPGFSCVVGKRVTIGHRAVVHGASIADDVLIGIGAIVLNGASIGSWSIIAAGALIPEGKIIPPNSLVMGVPGKVIRTLTEQDRDMIRHGSQHYMAVGEAYSRV